MRADSWDAASYGLPEWECRPHTSSNMWRSVHPARIYKEIDPVTGDTIAYHVNFHDLIDRAIYLDGRPHPPDEAAHTWAGFSTGKWEGDVLTIETTHMKEYLLKRDGIPVSDLAHMTEHWMRHGDFLTIVQIVYDPVYLTEPFIYSTDFALELHLDKIAHDLGIDPPDLKRRNFVQPNTRTVNWLRVTSCGLEECADRVLKASAYQQRTRTPGRGMGFAISSYLSGAGTAIYWNDMPHSEVQIKVDRGGVTVFCGAMEIGQGSDSVLATIVAEELGLEPSDVRLVTADTDTTPIDLGSYSSRVTFMAGNAALEAARKMRAMLVEAVAAKMGVEPAAVEVAGGRIGEHSFEEASVLGEARFGTLTSAGSYTPPKIAGHYKGSGVGPSPAYSYSACVVDLDADARTGLIQVNKVWIAHDVGRAINPLLVEGQVEGSVYMGLGEALMEEQVFRKGLHKWPSMLEYKSPTFLDMPEVKTFIVETDDPEGPYGAKEAGQGPLLPVPPAVSAAVFDALGVWIDEVPVTPEKVVEALRRKEKGEPPRYGPPRFPSIPYPEPIKVEPPPKDFDGRFAPQEKTY